MEIRKLTLDPGTTLLKIDQLIKKNIIQDSQRTVTTPDNKKDWNTILQNNFKLSNAEDGYRLAGQLFYHLQCSRGAIEQLMKEAKAQSQKEDNVSSAITTLTAEINKKFDLLSSEQALLKQHVTMLSVLPAQCQEPPTPTLLSNIVSGVTGTGMTPNTASPKYSKNNNLRPPSSSGPTEVITISLPTDPGEKNSACQDISKNLADVQVKFMKISDNRMTIGFPNADERGRAKANNEQLAKEKSLEITERPKMLPKITVKNVHKDIFNGMDLSALNGNPSNAEQKEKMENLRDLQKERILELILKKNPEVKLLVDNGHTLKVVYLQCDRALQKYYTMALQTSPAIRRQLINCQGGRLYLGNESYPFSDRFYYKVCFHCQELSHVAKDCPNRTNDPVCLYCSDAHQSSTCPVKKNPSRHNCAICLKSENQRVKKEANSHNTAAYEECPVQQNIINNIYNKTDFLSTQAM